MKTKIKRRERILRVREAEKRLTEMRLATAQRKAAEIDAMAMRIDQLEADMVTRQSFADGQALQNKASLQAMLDKARSDLSKPREASHAQCRQRQGEHMRASMRSEGALKIFEKTVKLAEAQREQREDANRPFIQRPKKGGLYS